MDISQKVKVLITGGVGHIGSALVQRLQSANYDITVLDDFSTQRYATALAFSVHNRVRVIPTSVFDSETLSYEVSRAHVVVHLAATTDASSSVNIPDLTYDNNILGTQVVLDMCRLKMKAMIFPSTTSVYGPSSDTLNEDSDTQPASPYAASKLYAERMVGQYQNAVTLRLGTIVGPSTGMRFHTAVNKFCWQAALGLPITVWKTAMNQMRPYLSLRDGVEAILFAITQAGMKKTFIPNFEVPGDIYRLKSVYNVVTSNKTVRRILDIIALYRPKMETQYVSHEVMNQLSYKVSSKRFRDAGWIPLYNIEDVIRDTMARLYGIRRAH